ncbi:MAG: serine hydrolase domain-containing protein [Clostridia bacterium]|nr:serine hydrolase domain-containing protein [Clostridia bacterium]
MNFSILTDYLNTLVYDKNTPCVDCIVYKNHKMIYRHFAGKSDLEADKDVSGDELYFIFSMTKLVTCTAALQLYEKGKYNLDDPISKYMPEFKKMKITADAPHADDTAKITTGHSIGSADIHIGSGYAKNAITVRHLFTMSAGFDYNIEAPFIKTALAEGKTDTRNLMGAMSNAVLGFEPGTCFNYSLCHDILGALIEIWSGESLGEYIRKNIFEPLCLKNTFFGVPSPEQKVKMAARYIFNDKGNPQRLPLENPYNLSPDYQSGGAGLCSTTEDYALLLDALACGGLCKTGNRILREDTVKLMHTDQLNGKEGPFEGYGYGLGVRVHRDPQKSGSLSPIGEFGWDGAAGCFGMVDADLQISLTHFQHIHAWDLNQRNGLRNALYLSLEE